MIEQHSNGDIPIARVGHFKIGQISGDGLIQVHLALLDQFHHSGGGEGLADGANPI